MGHHIDAQGQFQSDRHPDLEPDKIVLSFKDPSARLALLTYVWSVRLLGGDQELADDIGTRLRALEEARLSALDEEPRRPGRQTRRDLFFNGRGD